MKGYAAGDNVMQGTENGIFIMCKRKKGQKKAKKASRESLKNKAYLIVV